MNGTKLPLWSADFQQQLHREFESISRWWLQNVVNIKDGTIAAQVSNTNQSSNSPGKGLVFSARLLWFFSAAHRFSPNDEFEAAARLCARDLLDHYPDEAHGGMFWALNAADQPESFRKQSYGLAFAIYALSEFYLVLGEQEAMDQASALVVTLEKHARDQVRGGYLEAMSRSWAPIGDHRLSDADAHAEKTMNTHLHILEAYTNYYRATQDLAFRDTLADSLSMFVERFVRPMGEHLTRFYSTDWTEIPAAISFGHDIEASWLIWEAVEVLGDESLATQMTVPVLELAGGVLKRGVDQHGAISNEYMPGSFRDESRIWWVQAEAMVGFFNAWQLSGDVRYLEACRRCWAFIRRFQLDTKNGEWLWYSTIDDGAKPAYKAGRWKAPYHNGRAVIELLSRLAGLAQERVDPSLDEPGNGSTIAANAGQA